MIREMREKLSREIDQLSHELNVLLPQAIAQAVELGDLRENSEYKSALDRQQFVQARLGQLHQRLNQLSQLANTEAPTDRVGLGSKVTVLEDNLKVLFPFIFFWRKNANFWVHHLERDPWFFADVNRWAVDQNGALSIESG